MPEIKSPGDPSLPDFTPVSLNEEELSLLSDLVHYECVFQISSLFINGKRGSGDESAASVTRMFQIFSGYRSADDLLNATKEAYFVSNPGGTFELYFEFNFLRIFKNCLVYTPSDVALPASVSERLNKYSKGLIHKINLAMMSFSLPEKPQETKAQKLDDASPGMVQNIFSSKASA